jgi:ArsR family transcriptional regulator
MKALADTFKALSDETRLQIMTLLLDQEELCVCDFVGALEQTQSKISRHLRYLYHTGLVADRREGLWMHYRISPDLSRQQRAVVKALAAAVDDEQRLGLQQRLQAWLERKDESQASCGAESQATACC